MDEVLLQKRALEVRKGILTSVHSAKAGHPGGAGAGSLLRDGEPDAGAVAPGL